MRHIRRASKHCQRYDAAPTVRLRGTVASPGRVATISALVLVLTVGAAAQQQRPNVQHTENKPDLALRSGARVDPSTLGMSLSIPLASYPGRAGHGLPVAINYSSKVWRLDSMGLDPNFTVGAVNRTWTRPVFAEHSTAGWTSTLGAARVEFTGLGQYFDGEGHSACELCPPPDPMNPGQYYVRRIHVHMPDGSSHELRASDVAHPFASVEEQVQAFVGVFHAVDSSRMRFESNLGVPSVLYLPDGSRYFFPPYDRGRVLEVTHYVDRHKNLLSYDAGRREWTDTLGRGIADPLPVAVPDVPADEAGASAVTHFTAQLVGGVATYNFRWKRLAEVLTPDPATGRPPLHYTGDMSCSVRAERIDGDPPPPVLFRSSFDAYVCAWREGGNPARFNPVVLAEVELPTGNKYSFTYTVYGEIDTVSLPTGGGESFAYEQVPTLSYSSAPYDQTNRGAVSRTVREGAGAAESVWRYAVTSSNPYTVRTTPPDGLTYTERLVHKGLNARFADDFVRFGFDDARTGMVYEERVCRALDPERGCAAPGVLLRRSLSKWEEAGAMPPATHYAARNPRVAKQVSILFDGEGGQALAATTVTRYGQASQPLNPTSVTEYHYDSSKSKTTAATDGVDAFSPPDSLAVRTTETTYLDRQEYFDRGLVALPTSATVRAGMPGGSVISYAETRYDESDYPLLPCGARVGRFDSEDGVNTRGNATTSMRRLFRPDGNTDFVTHARYDACGCAREMTDSRGNVSKVEYSADYHEAYPTLTQTADPDGAGPLTALESRTEYDFRTGKVITTTDANGQETTFTYADEHDRPDLLGRLRGVGLPGGGRMRYDYGNTPGDLFVRTRAWIDAARHTESYQYFDGLGRPSRSFSRDGSAQGREWVAADTEYDTMMRVRRVSNPYFVREPGGGINAGQVEWTATAYDVLGRTESVTMPDGARAATAYEGDTATATDQAGRRRRSFTDALGRLVRVVEDPGGRGHETTYRYDALNNLTHVTQGGQIREFVYDSLSRLTSAKNPESGTVTYGYDPNGNLTKRRDARGVETGYKYDALNRVVERSYNDNTTPWVTYTYDGLPDAQGVFRLVENARGRLTEVRNGASTSRYTKYDAMGRVTESGQVTDGRAYEMGYTYDLSGSLTSQTYPSGRVVTTAYDGAGRLSSVVGTSGTGSHTYASEFKYAAHGAVEAMRLGNGLWEHAAFNSRLQAEQIGLGTSATDSRMLLLDYGYGTTNNNGNVQSQRVRAPGLDLTQSYTYDELNRLKIAQETGSAGQVWKQVYKYDQYGNRNFATGTTFPNYSQTQSDPVTGLPIDPVGNPEIDPATNRIKENQNADAEKEYEYDAAGNVTKNALGQTFTYDADSMQTSFNGGANSERGGASYSYDGNGRRVKKVTAGGETLFVYDAAGVLLAEYTTEAQPPDAGGQKYLTADTLGTPRVVTEKDGLVVSRHDYLPFGEEVFSGRTAEYRGDAVRQQFTGQERDRESSLDYFDARYYSSAHGRFTSTDPLAASARAGDPQTWNRYSYVLNNPLKFVDPTGMAPCAASASCSPDDSDQQQKKKKEEPPCISCDTTLPPWFPTPGGSTQTNPDAVVDVTIESLWWREDGTETIYNSTQQLGVATDLYRAELSVAVANEAEYWSIIKEAGEGHGVALYGMSKLPVLKDLIDLAGSSSTSGAAFTIAGVTADQVESAKNKTAHNATFEQRFVDAGIPRDRAKFYIGHIRDTAQSRAGPMVREHLGIQLNKGPSGWPIYSDVIRR